MGLSSRDFWALTPVQMVLFIRDWWDDMRDRSLQTAQLESRLIEIATNWGKDPKEHPYEPPPAPLDLVILQRRKGRPGFVKTVDGWIPEAEFKLRQAKVQQDAEEARLWKMAHGG